MQRYPIRPAVRKELTEPRLEALVRDAFGSVVRDGWTVTASYGAIGRIVVRRDGTELVVDLVMNPKVATEVAAETIKRYNRFLESATGYSAKERSSKLRKGPGSGGA